MKGKSNNSKEIYQFLTLNVTNVLIEIIKALFFQDL